MNIYINIVKYFFVDIFHRPRGKPETGRVQRPGICRE